MTTSEILRRTIAELKTRGVFTESQLEDIERIIVGNTERIPELLERYLRVQNGIDF